MNGGGPARTWCVATGSRHRSGPEDGGILAPGGRWEVGARWADGSSGGPNAVAGAAALSHGMWESLGVVEGAPGATAAGRCLSERSISPSGAIRVPPPSGNIFHLIRRNPQERLDHPRVKLPTRTPPQFLPGLLGGESLPVRSGRRHGIVGVRHPDDPRQKRDLLPHQPRRVTTTTVIFVVVPHRFDHRSRKFGRLQNLGPHHRVALHLFPLCLVQPPPA